MLLSLHYCLVRTTGQNFWIYAEFSQKELQNYAILSGKQAYVYDKMAIYDKVTATQNTGVLIIP